MNLKAQTLIGLVAVAGVVCSSAIASQPAEGGLRAERIADDIFRFSDSSVDPLAFVPSMALIRPFPSLGDAEGPYRTRPLFFETDDGKEGFRVPHFGGTSYYGTGEVSGPLLRNGRVIETWNHDAYGYGDDSEFLYKSHPWVLGVRADGSAFGVYADTTYRVRVDLTSGIEMVSEGPDFPVIVIERDSPQEVVTALGELTGTIEMPPKWAIGYHQCRYSYYPDARVREIADGFRDRNIPADVIWMDIDYMDEFKTFSFSPEHFPSPSSTNAYLHENGYHSIWMINPGVKIEPGYWVYEQGNEIDAWVQNADGETFVGEVWPGPCVFPDYTNSAVREWWATLYEDFMAQGVDGVWNDMNEPAVFNVESKTMPLDNIHRADPALGGPGDHARFHNVYGMYMVKASREGIMDANPDKRPFVLSRAGHMGSHRYAATWSGDNTATWYHMDVSIPMCINLGLSGQPFNGPDIGGFGGNGSAELFSRWMGFGAMFPFSRGHTGKGNIDKEPWAFGEDVETLSRLALNRRYVMMPFFYTLFREAHENGLPVMRPLFFHDPVDQAVRAEDDAFLLGTDVLVVPQLSPHRDRVPTMPRDFETGWVPFDLEPEDHADLPEMYLRAGSIVPTGPLKQYVDEKALDPLTLYVALDADGNATGHLYEDAGEGWDFRDGEFLKTRYEASTNDGTVTVRIASQSGKDRRPVRRAVVRVLLPDGTEAVGNGFDGDVIEIELP